MASERGLISLDTLRWRTVIDSWILAIYLVKEPIEDSCYLMRYRLTLVFMC